MQVLRHWIYLSYLAAMGMLGDLKRGIVTQKIIELNDIGIDPSVGVRFETISYANLQSSLMLAKNLEFDEFCDIGRFLVVANECDFIDLYGVDISDNLISRCQNNMSKVGVSASLSCMDVADFEIPFGKLVILLFNPYKKRG